jgi:hypothetical protein
MNNHRRAQINAIAIRISSELGPLIEANRADLEAVRDEEQEAFDSMPESFQNGGRGERSQEAGNELDNAIGSLEGLDIEDLESNLEAAAA